METFDSIQCEEYNAAFGCDEQRFAEWVEAMEELELDEVNRELRELSEEF